MTGQAREVKILRQLPLVAHGVMVLGFMVLGVMILGPWSTVRGSWFMVHGFVGSWVHGLMYSWYEKPMAGPDEERGKENE